MAFTAPYAVIAVDSREFDRAEWRDDAGNVVARSD